MHLCKPYNHNTVALSVFCRPTISSVGCKTNRQSANNKTPQLTIQQRLLYSKQFLQKIFHIHKKKSGTCLCLILPIICEKRHKKE